jgi:hypothetical protein
MSLTATQMSMMPDRRRLRAETVAHQILFALEVWIDRYERLERHIETEAKDNKEDYRGNPHVRRDLYREIFAALYAVGVEVITDADRAAAGLEWRNEKGMTETELRAMDARLTETLYSTKPLNIRIEDTPLA